MGNLNILLQQDSLRIIDQSVVDSHINPIKSFAIDDTLCATIGSGKSPSTARTWVHNDTLVLGIQDTKLPFLVDGINFLKQKGYRSIVRNSGGLAVILDDGVLNISLILSETKGKIDINRGYEVMLALIRHMFANFNEQIVAGEIIGSYCPGSYDLSIDGRKFAGISQRRLRNGVAVQIYLAVTKSGSERAELVRQFYKRAGAEKHPTIDYPLVKPNVTASLSELLSRQLTVEDVVSRLKYSLIEHSNSIYMGDFTTEENRLLNSYYERILKRNNKVFQSMLN